MTKQEMRALAELAAATHPITRYEKGHGVGLTARQWTKIVQTPGKTSFREREPLEFDQEQLLASERASERAHERAVQQRWEELHGAR